MVMLFLVQGNKKTNILKKKERIGKKTYPVDYFLHQWEECHFINNPPTTTTTTPAIIIEPANNKYKEGHWPA